MMRKTGIVTAASALLARTVGAECDASDKVLQLAQVQDISYSFGDSLVNLIPDIPGVEEDLAQMFHSVEIAVTSFSDKGTLPAGDPNGDYCYREDRGFEATSMVPVLNSLRILSGRDWRESSFDAVKYAVQSENLGWERTPYIDGKRAVRVALLATDALPHVKGTIFPSWPADDPRGCEFSDYPSVGDIGQILEEYDTYLIVVTIGSIFNSWNNLVKDIPNARVHVISNEDNVVEKIEDIICNLPPPPPMEGCGLSMPVAGSARDSCDEVCGAGYVCNDVDTARIGTSMDDCNHALDELYEEPKLLDFTLDLFPYAGGCNTLPLFGVRKTILRPDGDGCSAQNGHSYKVQRVCCCAEVGPDLPGSNGLNGTMGGKPRSATTATWGIPGSNGLNGTMGGKPVKKDGA